MATVSHLFLCEQLGENSTTIHDPVAVLASWDENAKTATTKGGKTVDLNETVGCCLSSDDNRLVSKARYSVRRIELPEWMSPEEWLANSTQWKWFKGMGGNEELPALWCRRLMRFGEKQKLACIKLLNTKNFRSDFRRSLRERLESWLSEEEHDYDSPFSHRQWGCLINGYLAREADQISNQLYWSRSPYVGVVNECLFHA